MATRNAIAVSDLSPPDSSDSRLTFLPGGLASKSIPVASMSSGSVSTSRPSPPGNSRPKMSSNSRAVSSKAAVNTCCTRSSTSLTTISKSRRVFLRSSSWVARNEWRSSRAANSSRASGFTLPSSSSWRCAAAAPPVLDTPGSPVLGTPGRPTLRAAGWPALGTPGRPVLSAAAWPTLGTPGRPVLGAAAWPALGTPGRPVLGGIRSCFHGRRDKDVRAVLGDERGHVHAEFLRGPHGKLLQPHPLLSPGDLGAMGTVHYRVEFGGQLPDLPANLFECLRPPLAGLLGGLGVLGRRGQRLGQSDQRQRGALGHGPRHYGLPGPQHAPGDS